MYKIINRHVYEIASGENITLCDIVADTSTDLPDAGDIALYKIAFGSFAYVIDEGVFYSLDSSGTWNGGSYSEVVDEVITARGSFSSLDARLDDMDVILNSAKLGVKYKGAVNYYNDLPATGNEIGDAYTVKYAGSSGTTPDGTEYVWGELSGVTQWIDFSKDCYTKSEINTLLSSKQNTLTFDNTPTQGSTNPVTSGGVYAAIEIIDISDKITAKSGYTINSLTKIYKQGSHIFGQIIINKSGGNFGLTPETAAAFDIGYRPIAQQIQVCMVDTSDYGTQYIGHCDIAPADHPYFAGNISISSYQANVGNVANIHVDFIV